MEYWGIHPESRCLTGRDPDRAHLCNSPTQFWGTQTCKALYILVSFPLHPKCRPYPNWVPFESAFSLNIHCAHHYHLMPPLGPSPLEAQPSPSLPHHHSFQPKGPADSQMSLLCSWRTQLLLEGRGCPAGLLAPTRGCVVTFSQCNKSTSDECNFQPTVLKMQLCVPDARLAAESQGQRGRKKGSWVPEWPHKSPLLKLCTDTHTGKNRLYCLKPRFPGLSVRDKQAGCLWPLLPLTFCSTQSQGHLMPHSTLTG